MIIWSRWGILVVPIVAVGVALGGLAGVVLAAVTGAAIPENLYLGPGLILGALFVWLFDRLALPHLDRARQQFVLQPMAQPVTHPNGYRQTHQQVPLVDQAGRQVWVRPRSTLFFVPVRYWSFVVAAIGLLVVISTLLGALAG